MRRTLAHALACLAFAVPAGAQAAPATAHVGWRDVVLSVVDLNPSDGISAALTATLHTHCESYDIFYFCLDEAVDPGYRIASSYEQSLSVSPWGLGYESFADIWVERLDFELTPDTRLTITGTVYSQSTGPDVVIEDLGGNFWVRAMAFAGGRASITTGDGRSVMVATRNEGQREASFALSMTSGSGTLVNWLSLNSTALGGATQQYFIPEPSTYALMLGGLGWVALLARRRRPQADAKRPAARNPLRSPHARLT